MNKKFLYILLALVLALTFSPSGHAFAATSSIIPIAGVANTCTSTGFSFQTAFVFTGTGSDKFQMTAPGAGQLNSSFTQESTIGYPVGTGTGFYGTGSLNYSLPPNTPITLTITTFSGNNYTGGSTTASLTYNCTTGAAYVYQGPPIPAGFVLRPITCTTAVFDTPGGSPVSDNIVKAGQTWYVSPNAVKDANGKLWTGIFVSSYNIPYIPTECAFPTQRVTIVQKLDLPSYAQSNLVVSFGTGGGKSTGTH